MESSQNLGILEYEKQFHFFMYIAFSKSIGNKPIWILFHILTNILFICLDIPIIDLIPTSLVTFPLLESDHDFDPKCIHHTAHSVGLNFHKCQFPSEKILPLD